ncbi:MAG: nitrite reductase small subunit [Trichococcus sp.]|jgi:nitrite reductase (NADH) small subunit|nr:nitrite reductase small subunit [Trichococcus sp.]
MTEKIFLTTTAALLPQVGRSISIGDKKIALFQLSDGRITAIEDYCPLTGGPVLEGIVSGEYLYEPLRDYKISLLDGRIQEPDEGQLKVYELLVEDGNIYLKGASV